MQEIMKNLICAVADAGLTQTVYFSFHVLDFISVFILAFWMGPKLNLSRGRTMMIVVAIYPLLYVWMLVYYWILSGFHNFGGQNLVTIFIHVPIAGLLAAKLLKIEWKKVCYFLAPCMPLIQTIGHLGCIFTGCCGGYECAWGLYSLETGNYYFPTQPIESLVAASIVLILLSKAKKENYVPDARQYPLMLILYGSTRFICEFLRANEKIWMGCSRLAFHALFMCLVGVVALVIVGRKEKALQKAD